MWRARQWRTGFHDQLARGRSSFPCSGCPAGDSNLRTMLKTSTTHSASRAERRLPAADGRQAESTSGRPSAPGQPVRPRPARQPAQARSSRPARPASRRRRHQLIELAIAFVLRPRSPRPSSAPSMEHLESQLTATGVHLTHDVLDRTDQIVAPGNTRTGISECRCQVAGRREARKYSAGIRRAAHRAYGE